MKQPSKSVRLREQKLRKHIFDLCSRAKKGNRAAQRQLEQLASDPATKNAVERLIKSYFDLPDKNTRMRSGTLPRVPTGRKNLGRNY